MSPYCDNCESHVSKNYYRVRKGNDGELHACRSCCDSLRRTRKAAGAEPRRNKRGNAAGVVIPRGSD